MEEIKEYYIFNKFSPKEYLDKYPNGKYSEFSKLKLDKEESECFEKESASAYLDKYPDGRYKENTEYDIKETKFVVLLWVFILLAGVTVSILSSFL